MFSIGYSALIVFLGVSTAQYATRIDISDTQLNSSSQSFSNYQPKLKIKNDFTESALLSGIWLMYEETNFNEGNPGGKVIYGWGYNHSIEHIDFKKISSLRYSGTESGLQFDTLNLYEDPGFIGNEEMYYQDVSVLARPFFGKSIILTGCKPWTLFSEINFHGEHICVYPRSRSLDECAPGFYETPKDFGGFVNKVKSIRLGCFSGTAFKGLDLNMNTTRYFNYN